MMTLDEAKDNAGAPVFWHDNPQYQSGEVSTRVGFIQDTTAGTVRVLAYTQNGGSYTMHLSPERLSIDPRVGFRPRAQRGSWVPGGGK